MKRAAGYIRKGRGEADERRQREAIEAYCMKNDMQIVEWLSGERGFGEIAYGKWIGHRRIYAVIAASAGDVTDSVYEFYAYKCKLRMRDSNLFVAEGETFAGYGLYRKVFEEFTDVLCRLELENDPVLTANTRARKTAKGQYIGGQAPMGYKVENGRLLVNEDEVPAVLFILEQKRAGKTMLGTVEELNARGYKTRRGGKFVISTVQSIWNNEKFYCGYRKDAQSGDWVKGEHEALISDRE